MNTPILDFVKNYASSDVSRFHMPGHKGQPFLGCEPYDITEVEGADVLYAADGIIAESERNATALFDTAHSFYSTEGSSLCIKAMLGLIAKNAPKGSRPRILAARNVHKAFVYACALLDLDVTWLYPKENEHLCSCTVHAEDVERALSALPHPPAALYLTSPDYLGQTAEIEAIATVCHANGVPLLVDNAHGAYLQFLSPSRHPIALGADLCCDSAHKTLPVLTGGAYLHVSKHADARYCEDARSMLSLFASTSPSYLILQSLDLCNRYLLDGYREKLQACVSRTEEIKQTLSARGFTLERTEPLKIVFHAKKAGFCGSELAEHLRRHGIEAEFADEFYLVLMVSPENREKDFTRLLNAFEQIEPKIPILPLHLSVGKAQTACTIREAILSPHETVSVRDAEGRICASPTVSCPPAVPVVISGEVITEEAIAFLFRYGIERVEVVKR